MTVGSSTVDLKTGLSQDVGTLLQVGLEDLEAVMKHYDVSTDQLNDMIQNVHDWFKKETHLPQGKLHDRMILGFLIIRGFSIQRTKWSIDNFYTSRSRLCELTCGRDVSDEAWLWYLQRLWFVLPKKTAENHRIILFRMDKEEPLSVLQILRAGILFYEYRLWNDVSVGDCWIFDFKHSTIQLAVQITPTIISQILFLWKSAYGAKLIHIHIINLPSFGTAILNIFKKNLKSKIIDRIHVSTEKDLLNVFSKDVLPKEYGGTGVSCQEISDGWAKMYQSEPWRNYLVEQDSIRADESKRLTPSKADGMFGIDGSFRKLCLD